MLVLRLYDGLSPIALVAPVGWLMFLSSNTACVRHVVWLSISCSQRKPAMLLVSWRRKPACSAVCATLGAENPFANRLTVPHPNAAVAATAQPRWNGLASN